MSKFHTDYISVAGYDKCGGMDRSLGTTYESEAVREVEDLAKKGFRSVVKLSAGRGDERRWRGWLVPEGTSADVVRGAIYGSKVPPGMTKTSKFNPDVKVPALLDKKTCARMRIDERTREISEQMDDEFGEDRP